MDIDIGIEDSVFFFTAVPKVREETAVEVSA
jgi:hypothetical protein